MIIDELKNQLPDFAKDIRLNISNVLTETGSTGLQLKQIYFIATASAMTTKNKMVIDNIVETAKTYLSPQEIDAAKSAAVIMAMNNVYYRFTHLVHDKSYATMPAKLRMNVIANPGVDKIDFELASLAVSAINGCGMCMDAHANVLTKAMISKEAIQSAVRIASVVNALSLALEI